MDRLLIVLGSTHAHVECRPVCEQMACTLSSKRTFSIASEADGWTTTGFCGQAARANCVAWLEAAREAVRSLTCSNPSGLSRPLDRPTGTSRHASRHRSVYVADTGKGMASFYRTNFTVKELLQRFDIFHLLCGKRALEARSPSFSHTTGTGE